MTATNPLRRAAGLLGRNDDFRRLWTGSTAAKFGSTVSSIALPLIAATVLGAGPFEVGALSAAAWAPWLLIGLPAGAWVDRLPRRPIMLAADAASLLLFAGIPVAAALGYLSIGYLLATALLGGVAAVFFETASGALMPRIVEEEDRPEGNAKLYGTASAMQIAGYGAGGTAVQLLGPAYAMAVNAATFLVSLVCTYRVRHREHLAPRAAATADAPRPRLRSEIAEGMRLAARDPLLRMQAVFGGLANMALMAYQAVLLLFLVRESGLPSSAIGLLMTTSGIGGLLGAVAGRRLAARIGSSRAVLLLLIAAPALGLLIPLTATGPRLGFFLVGYPAIAFGIVGGNTVWATFKQRYVPADRYARLTTCTSFLNYGTIPVGSLLGGALGQALGLDTALWVGLAALPLSGCVLLFSPMRRMRDLPDAPPAEAADRAREIGCGVSERGASIAA
ncbi:MFS transporter [Mangrovactinospora gilvigrisea]|uniref:MFS transporter n=1 Tax=Mangrovactinospora gilvigrisea TaxID=1428644 RepID=A0A1J7BGG4_9ACTN|nr:MFS transporter [Mangrovactinospora gilvigrisea]OIV37653.1 MFS transporter [Mangrovactinospora gilvigrisea]